MKKKKNMNGIGLLEVLMALVVISIGLLAINSLQISLLVNSSDMKKRVEARSLAEGTLEVLRSDVLSSDPGDDISLSSFEENLAVGETVEADIDGQNATFTRTVTITDGAAAHQKLLTVTVSWRGLAGVTSEVVVGSEIVYRDPTLSLTYAKATVEGGLPLISPSPNNNSSMIGGEPYSVLKPFEKVLSPSDHHPEWAEFTDIYKGFDADGNAVLFDHISGETLLTCFGHKILPITGTVHTLNTLNDITVDVSQHGVCKFDPNTGDTDAPYACFVCGSCDSSWGDTDDEGNLVCNGDTGGTPSASALAAYNDNGIGAGGWRGKVGLKGVGDAGGNQEQTCFNEQILDPDAGASTGREYTTHRTLSGSTSSEGINTPYECHDFLVVNSSGPDSSCATAAADLATVSNFAPKKILRELAGTEDDDPNTVLALNSDYCTIAPSIVTVNGTVTVLATPTVNFNKLTLAMGSGGVCDPLTQVGVSNVYSFSCTATTSSTVVAFSLTTTQTNGAQAVAIQSPDLVTVDVTDPLMPVPSSINFNIVNP